MFLIARTVWALLPGIGSPKFFVFKQRMSRRSFASRQRVRRRIESLLQEPSRKSRIIDPFQDSTRRSYLWFCLFRLSTESPRTTLLRGGPYGRRWLALVVP